MIRRLACITATLVTLSYYVTFSVPTLSHTPLFNAVAIFGGLALPILDKTSRRIAIAAVLVLSIGFTVTYSGCRILSWLLPANFAFSKTAALLLIAVITFVGIACGVVSALLWKDCRNHIRNHPSGASYHEIATQTRGERFRALLKNVYHEAIFP